MKAVNPKATRDYVPECDRELPEADRTVFELAQLTAEEQAFLKDVSPMGGTAINACLHLGLNGVRNFKDDKGDPIVLKRVLDAGAVFGKKKPWGNLTTIPMGVRDEVAAQILKGADLEGPEVKNS